MLFIFLYLAVVVGMFAWGRHLVMNQRRKDGYSPDQESEVDSA